MNRQQTIYSQDEAWDISASEKQIWFIDEDKSHDLDG